MRLKKLINELAKTLQNEAGADYFEGCEDYGVEATFNTENGWIDMYYRRGGYVEVIVYHDYNDHYSSLLESYLSENLKDCIDWDTIREEWEESNMDEYQRNGFADEADFWHWKEG